MLCCSWTRSCTHSVSLELPLCARPLLGTEETETNALPNAAPGHSPSLGSNSTLMAQISLSADQSGGHRGCLVHQARGHTCALPALQCGEWATVGGMGPSRKRIDLIDERSHAAKPGFPNCFLETHNPRAAGNVPKVAQIKFHLTINFFFKSYSPTAMQVKIETSCYDPIRWGDEKHDNSRGWKLGEGQVSPTPG